MDLPGPAAVGEALAARAAHPALGYTGCDPRGRDLVADWYLSRHGVRVDPDWVMLLPVGPRTAVRLLLDALAAERDDHPGPVLLPRPSTAASPPPAAPPGFPARRCRLNCGPTATGCPQPSSGSGPAGQAAPPPCC